MNQVPLLGRVIFSDWHGVLSRDPFWTSIRQSATHPLHAQLEEKMAGVFDPSRNTASDWMKGLLSSEQIIAEMGIQLPARFGADFLSRRLDLDCARMKVNVELFEILRVLRAKAIVVVATDNMDCFARTFEHAYRSRHRRSRDRATLADWAVICDDIICSSQAGALKSEDPQAFFGPWLTSHAIRFADAILIDDRADNCAAFTSQGGTAIQWKMGTNPTSGLADSLRRWLDTDTHPMAGPASQSAPATI